MDKKLKYFSKLDFLDEFNRKFPKAAFSLKSNLEMLHYENYFNMLKRKIPTNARVLEVGCGSGILSFLLQTIRPDIELVATENVIRKNENNAQVYLHKKLYKKGFKIIEMDAIDLKFKNDFFDAVVSFGVMEHVENDTRFLSEINRVLKRGGYNFIFNLPNKFSLNDFLARTFLNGGHKFRYTKKQINNLFNKHGFKITRIKKEHFIPSQVSRISNHMNTFFNKHYKSIDTVDKFLTKTPLNFFVQTYNITSIKK